MRPVTTCPASDSRVDSSVIGASVLIIAWMQMRNFSDSIGQRFTDSDRSGETAPSKAPRQAGSKL